VAVWELQAELQGPQGQPLLNEPAPLRLFAVHDAPRRNTGHASRLPFAGKVHLEHACRWANGASENVAVGPTSIAHQVANHLRHYVHPGPAYEGLPAPANYARLPGHAEIEGGVRPKSPLHLPLPPHVSEAAYQRHYAESYGWQVLDHPTHPGGRCNQQASALVDVLGTLGIAARVVHIERIGKARRGPDAVDAYQGFKTRRGVDGWWDLHAVAEVRLDDGALHYYDCSFSRPDRGRGRLHGTAQEVFAAKLTDPRALFVYAWGPWFYRLDRLEVPPDHAPTEWTGVD
jgi:hypothetical protein